MSDRVYDIKTAHIPPELADRQTQVYDRAVFGFSVTGPDGERVDPRAVTPYPSKVYVLMAVEAQPETRVDHGSTIDTLVGVYASQERAELAFKEHVAYRVAEAIEEGAWADASITKLAERTGHSPQQMAAESELAYMDEMELHAEITETLVIS